MPTSNYQHVNYLWNDTHTQSLTEAEKLVYRSNLLGSDQRITNTGGGNTSAKVTESDPVTGEDTSVIWVKGSGGDLRTSTVENFSSLYLDKLLALEKIYDQAPEKGVKTVIEDEMVGLYNHTTFNLNPRKTSIDTPLHGYLPFAHVDHMHPNSVISIAACKDQVALTKEIFGEEVGYVGWQRPGFDLGLIMREEARKNPNLKGLVMGTEILRARRRRENRNPRRSSPMAPRESLTVQEIHWYRTVRFEYYSLRQFC